MTRSHNIFINLLVQDDPPSHSQYLNTAEGLLESPSQIAFNEEIQDQLLLDLEKTAGRLARLFHVFGPRNIQEKVADQLTLHLLLPIVSVAHGIGDLQIITQILISGLPLILGGSIASLQKLGDVVTQTDNLLERIATDQKGGQVMKALVDKLGKSGLKAGMLYSITYRLMTLCDSCTHDHGTGVLSERWQELLRLRISLQQLHSEFEAHEEGQRTRNIPTISHLTPLGKEDKKDYKVQTGRLSQMPNISQEVSSSLSLFQLQQPHSLRALDTIIDSLRTEKTLAVLISSIESFPCRPCNEVARGSSGPREMIPINTDTTKRVETSFDSEIFGKRIGEWKVLLSSQAMRDLKNLYHSGLSDVLKNKLRELAKGDWSGKSLSYRAGSTSQRKHMRVPVLRANCTQKIFILWQVDVGVYDDFDHVTQLIKVWQIVDHGKLPDAIDQIIRLQNAYEPLSIQPEGPIQKPDGTFIPRQFKSLDDQTVSFPARYDGDLQKMEKGLMEMSTKFYSLTEPLLRSLFSNNLTAEFPFELSKEELKIITHFRTSSLILGRSGTGKTTCIVFKLLSRLKARGCLLEEFPLRQACFSNILSRLGLTNASDWKVLLTRSHYLATKLKNYTRNLFESQIPDTLLQDVFPEDDEMLDAEEGTARTDTVFSACKPPFPLVCTFDKFLDLLENTIRMADRQNFDEGAIQNLKPPGPRVLDFHIFKTEYWVKFPNNLKRDISVDLVFAEIMGVLKGSIYSTETLNPLSLEQYFETSCRLAPAFATDLERARMYEIYDLYEKTKMDRGEIDQVDRVIALLDSLKNNPKLCDQLGQAFEEVYVDEVQDLRCLDIVLLLSTIRNARGIHLAGDTAQCISNDSTFRFSEMKDLFYQRYSSTSKTTNQEELAKPVQFTLAKNYRSHQGILTMASLVMKMLWSGFPDTIDKLTPESSHVAGPRPLVFVGFDAEILSLRMIGLVNLNDRLSDFGAEQAILVRDEDAKKKLKARIGDIALIMTILDSKGMEFDDVLLYNFFSDSGHGSNYRRLHLLLDRDKYFDAKKDAVMCSELKHLYVAVTRARKQLWFLESSRDLTEPVLELFKTHDGESLIEVVRPTDRNVADKIKILRAGASVDPKRWTDRGKHFLENKKYTDALFCFNKADDKQGSIKAMAYLNEQEARTCKALGDHGGFIKNSEAAVSLFLEVQLISNASKCLENLEEFERAATLWFDRKKYEKAAELFQLAKLFEKASQCYHANHNYNKAAETLHLGSIYDQLIIYLSLNSARLESSLCQKYSRICNLLLKQGRVPLELRARCINLLGSDERKEQFLKDFEMTSHLAALYKAQGRHRELYQILAEDGQLRSAFESIVLYDLYHSILEEEIVMVFNLLHAEMFFQGNESEIETFLVSSQWKKNAPQFLLSASAGWEAASHILSSIKKGETPGELKLVQNPAIREWLCLFVISFLPELILGTNSILCLPIEILKEITILVQGPLPGKPAFHSTSLVLCGILITPSHKEFRLSWSPLSRTVTSSNEVDDPNSMDQRAVEWVLSRLSVAVANFDDKARELWASNWPEPCLHFSSKGFCKAPDCQRLHKRITTEGHFSMINELLQITSVFSRMSQIYFGRFMDQNFQEKFLKRRRYWLERLIRAMTYVSGLEQAISAVRKLISSLYSSNEHLTVVSHLEELLFHRISKEWETRSSLSSIMAQFQFSTNLGPNVDTRFLRAMSRKLWYEDRFNYRPNIRQENDKIRMNLKAVRCFQRIRIAVLNDDEDSFVVNFRPLLDHYAQSTMQDLAEFHAITSTFEFITSYLLFARTKTQPIAIPWSWAVLHISAILRRISIPPNSCSEERGFRYTQCLIDVVVCFSDLLSRLSMAIADRFPLSFGARSMLPILVQRRNVELIAVVALNLGNDKNLAIRWGDTWRRIQEVFQLRFSPLPYFQQSNYQCFLEAFAAGYQAYNGKDRLTVLATSSGQKPSKILDKILELGATWISHEEILSASSFDDMWRSSIDGPSTDNDIEDPLAGNELTNQETQAAVKIQRYWRCHSSKVRDARTFSQSRDGKIINSYLDIFAACIPKGPPTKLVIAIRALLLTLGLELQKQLNQLWDSLKFVHKRLSAQLADQSIPVSRLESLEKAWPEVLRCESEANQLGNRWSAEAMRVEVWWLDPVELQSRAEKDIKGLRRLQDEADRLNEFET